MIKAATDWDF